MSSGWSRTLRGAPLPGATVEAASPSLQGIRVTTSGRDGTYRLPGLPPGIYRIKAVLAGFGAAEETATVSLDATATVNFTLKVEAREEILVSGDIPLVDVTSTTGGTDYINKVIVRLPVARNYADIVRSNPGVSTDLGETHGRSLALTIYGASSVENQWLVDGINTTNVIQGFQGKAINNEFIQEVEVKTGGYQAEYGRALGGVINVITKSGGNEFHGDGFVYYDSFDTAAKQTITGEDSIADAMRFADYKRTDFGADLGGYFFKDRLWFFGAYNRVETPAKVSRYVSSVLVPEHARVSSRFDRQPLLGQAHVERGDGHDARRDGPGRSDDQLRSGRVRSASGAFDVPDHESRPGDLAGHAPHRRHGLQFARDSALRFQRVAGSSGIASRRPVRVDNGGVRQGRSTS